MSEPEPTTVAELAEQIIAERGGPQRFSAVQKRLCGTIALALRDPSKVDPTTVTRLLEMLPPRIVPPEAQGHPNRLEVCFVGDYDMQLQAAIDASADDCARVALQHALHRIVALEAERDGLKQAVADLRSILERAHIQSPREGAGFASGRSWLSDSGERENGISDSPTGNAGHGNVVRLRDERHSLRIDTPLDQRYPRGLEPVS
jgi:hypothetical protein